MEEFLIGNLGSEKILTSLSTTTYPLQFISQFQQENGISKKSLPTVSPVLNLLDLHQIPRGDLYLNLLSSLKKDLLLKINTLNKHELEKLLEQTFPYIGFEELQEIPMNVMKRLTPEVPVAFLLKLAEAEELYEQCPIEVKRQIWIVNEELFKEKIKPLINQYIEDPIFIQDMNEQLLLSSSTTVDPLFAVSHLPAKRRENNSVLQEMVELFGTKSPDLYQMFINQIKRSFADSGNYLLCNLRAEILMAIHDKSIPEIYDTDASHNIAWCLDACIRDNTLDARRIKEIQTNLSSSVHHQNSSTLGDTAMVFANPIAVNCIVRNILIQLKEVVKRKQIPKDDESIKFLTYLLVLALKSHEMIKESKFKIPHVKKHILQTFYPLLATQILDDITREQTSTISLSSSSTSNTSSTNPANTISSNLNSSSSTVIKDISSGGGSSVNSGGNSGNNSGGGTGNNTIGTNINKSSNNLLSMSSSTSPVLESTSLMSVSEFQDLENCYLKYEVCKKITLSYIINRALDKDLISVDRYLKFIYKLILQDNNITESTPNPTIQSPTVSSVDTTTTTTTTNQSDTSNTTPTPTTTTTTATTTTTTQSTEDSTYEQLSNVDIYKYFGNDFIQSMVSQVLQVKEQRFNSIIIDSFLFKFRFLPFIQKQLIRYLLENHTRMNQREFIHFIQKLYNSVLSTYKKQQQQQQQQQTIEGNNNVNKKLLDDIVHSTRLLIDKTSQRYNEKIALSLYEFYKLNQKQFLSPTLTNQQQQHQHLLQQHSQLSQPIDKMVSPTLSSSELISAPSSTSSVSNNTGSNITSAPPSSTESPMETSSNNINNNSNNNNNNNSSSSSSSNAPMDTTSDSNWD
ncbi:hypothetical protein DDB_G0284195 [Dictyostelium discoideum AX4]|uniref:Negative elongation factor B n=1 Tax=Dictyostelium discoideum TaxID=44689 RepID=Q54Q08_DICDI|nr:hypothetical protein DDB_G0284195 [Dictyostelium discoideum AX4]EAL65286.1 hypothetical protein DDB_G0284195 [Dictyostelium discoideum AX4]|eukprot:XP_638637.1 hypothetical protein DDB_G0284195 [Dictyostelium discoideum AX4]